MILVFFVFPVKASLVLRLGLTLLVIVLDCSDFISLIYVNCGIYQFLFIDTVIGALYRCEMRCTCSTSTLCPDIIVYNSLDNFVLKVP